MVVRVLILNPSGEESPGLLMEPLVEEGCEVVELASRSVVDLMCESSHVTATVVDRFPASSRGFDVLVVLGSPLGVLTGAGALEEDQTPGEVVSEIEALVRDFHGRGQPVLGICLGSQLVARAFGGAVTRLPRDAAHTAFPCALRGVEAPPAGTEFGWLAQDFTEAAADDAVLKVAMGAWLDATPPSALPPKFMQLHSDTFSLPPGAVLLSTRDTCANQAFRLGDSTYAFQYHVEVSEGLSKDWFEEYVSGEDSFAPKDDWEPLSDDRDVLALRSAHAAAVAEGSVARASAFTRALVRELVAKARRKRTATATLGALAALAALAAAAALFAARKRAY